MIRAIRQNYVLVAYACVSAMLRGLRIYIELSDMHHHEKCIVFILQINVSEMFGVSLHK